MTSDLTADYMVGLERIALSPRFPGSLIYLDAATPMDSYYPDVNTKESTIDKEMRSKPSGGQAPVVVIDMSRNAFLQQQYSSNSLDTWTAAKLNPARGVTVPERVIYILNGEVVYDTAANPELGFKSFGPGPDPSRVA